MIQFPQFDESKVKSQINDIYTVSNNFPNPTILILDSPISCKFAHKLVLDLYNLKGLNLTEQHLNIPTKRKWENRNIEIKLRRFYSNVFPSTSIKEVDNKTINLIKNIFFGNQKLVNDWDSLKEETKEIVKNKIWNNLINSKMNYFEFQFNNLCNFDIEEIYFTLYMKTYCIVCKNPLYALTDDNNLPHSTDGKCIEFADGFGSYAVHGINFDEELYKKIYINRNITSDEILSIKNTEQRACAIEFYGYDKLIKELKAVKLDERLSTSDVDGMPIYEELYEFNIDGRMGRRTFRFVKVEDYSTHTIHCLGVPSIDQTKTVMGAVAWTYAMNVDEYKPSIRT